MADLTITAADVVKGSSSSTDAGTAGASITAGQAVYKDTGDSDKWKLADNDDTALKAGSGGLGIALHAASSGQPLTILLSGDLDVGATLTVGEVYVLSSTAGGICPVADLGTGDYVTILGVATAADNLRVSKNVSGIQHA